MTWIVTGGAGYIGSEVVFQLLKSGREVLVIDDLSTGSAQSIPDGANLLELDLRDPRLEQRLPAGLVIDGVIHAAGIKYAGESVRWPEEHFSRNVAATFSLVNACRTWDVPKLIFSSSSSVYGTPIALPVGEDAPLNPTSPYGRSKVAAEWLVQDFAEAHGLAHTSLRFFNVVGVGECGVADSSPYNLFPNLIRATQTGEAFEFFGSDLDTPDGTCVRDYIYVSDIAAGHLAVIAAWEKGKELAPAYNLGLGRGFSVAEVVAQFELTLGRSLKKCSRPPRASDPPILWAASELARRDLDWAPKSSLEQIVESCVSGMVP